MSLRDLDALVAAKVLNCAVIKNGDRYECGCEGEPHGEPGGIGRGVANFTSLRRYSEDWGAMREVVQTLVDGHAMLFAVEMSTNGDARVGFWNCERSGWADSTTLPWAVCRAALAALGSEVPS